MYTLSFGGIDRNPRFDHVYQGTTLAAVLSASAGEPDPEGTVFEWTIGERVFRTDHGLYTLEQQDVGKAVSVRALLPDGSGQAAVAAEGARMVLEVNDGPSGWLYIPQLPAERVAGATLTLAGRIDDNEGMGPPNYQWLADGQPITGATGPAYTLTMADMGKEIGFVVSYVDGLGVASTYRSDGALVPNTPGTLAFDASLAPGRVVQARVSDADGATAVHYAWDVQGAEGSWTPVAGAGTAAFEVGDAAPPALRAFADYADDRGHVETLVATLGTDGADDIRAGWNNEQVYAGAGNDTIRYAYAWFRVDGGDGLDTYVAGTGSARVAQDPADPRLWHVFEGLAAGGATLAGVERVQAGAQAFALDLDGAGGRAFRLYQAAFDRAPELAGIGYWIARLDQGASLQQVAQAFVASDEFAALYGAAPDHAAMVDGFYRHVLHRAPDPASQFWVDLLDRKAASPADVLVGFSESAENVAALVGVMANGIAYQPYA